MVSFLNVDDVRDSGITIITNDNNRLCGKEPITQEQLDMMCSELMAVLAKYDFGVELVLENEVAMRLQGKLMFKKFYDVLEASVFGN